jgi:hypothetical protein
MLKTTFHNESAISQSFNFISIPPEFKDIKLADDDDLSILEAEFLEPKENQVKIFKRISNSNIATSKSVSEILEEILEINKILLVSCEGKTEINAKANIRLSYLFTYRGYWSVKNYLSTNIQLRDLLFETYFKLKDFFGDNAEFILELVRDIYEPEFEQLFIRVIFNQDFNKGLEILDSFEKKWWFERTAYFLNSPVITLE